MEFGPVAIDRRRWRIRGVNGKWTKAPREYVYRPRRLVNGHLAPLLSRPSPDVPALRALVHAMQKTLKVNVYAIPTETWNRLMDLLPVCECGRVVAPYKIRRSQRANGYCEKRCKVRRDRRLADHRLRIQDRERVARGEPPRLVPPNERREAARALAEEIGQ